MLKVQSFKFSDSEGINALLSQYRLAQGASIFVSNGEICIPYEDGEALNNSQKIIAIKEKVNGLKQSIDIIEHTLMVDRGLLEKVTERMNEVKADLAEAEGTKGKNKYDTSKELNKRISDLEQGVQEVKNRIMTNEQEILRMETEIEIYEEEIGELGA